VLLRKGKAGSNTAADHIETAKLALGQVPKARRQVLVRPIPAAEPASSWPG
jgi:hypothetical protein